MICDFMPVSLADYPGCVAATVFVWGCNFRCPYCHNSSIIRSESGFPYNPAYEGEELNASFEMQNAPGRYAQGEVIGYLAAKKKLIDGICITGGEPTLWPDLKNFAAAIKALGFKVKLDTNGSRPGVLRDILEQGLADYVAMDVKAPIYRYSLFAPDEKDILNVQKSVDIIMLHGAFGGKIDYEFRTTVHEKILELHDIEEIGRWLSGAKRYVLQGYKYSPGVLDEDFCGTKPCGVTFLKEASAVVAKHFEEVLIRS
ncbi:MAG: anaerobic ribonucleoside-triphosphate reductase activating protein [Tepidanaerobacteraceae bacterium]|jgi:pyruvate formate lyase activating enzyme|nr:anaerobic ribonucleoside-triphosphate reductase activating protein [Tepidanaerobacteraceae bacterium]